MPLIWFLLKNSWITVAIAIFTGFLSGACNASGLALINNAIAANEASRNDLLLGFIGLAIAALATSIISQFLLVDLSYEAIYKMRLRLSGAILVCPLRHLEELGNNRILATLTEDTQAIADTISIIPFMCIDVAVIFGCLIYLCWLSWQVFLVIIVFLGAGIFCVRYLFSKGYRLLERSREQQDRLFKHFRTITDGIKELKLNLHRRQAFMDEELKVAALDSRKYDVTSMKIFGLSSGVGQFFFFSILGLLVFGLPRFNLMNSEILSGYILVTIYLIDPLQRIVEWLPGLSRGSVALQKIDTLGLSLASNTEEIVEQVKSPSAFDRIELNQTTYTYRLNRDENFTLGAIDFSFSSGEIIFIVGGNGSGKSTLAKLIAGLYIPDAGEILLDGKPVTERNRESYRQLFSTVFSDFYLFDRFLGLQLNERGEQAQKYLQQLQLERKVQIQGDRLSTIELSQGQRKRLALLTAYLEDRPIYLFDEWAADQDPFFREIFYKQLLPELKNRGKTILAISHDDRYFHLCDRIIKLDYGQLV